MDYDSPWKEAMDRYFEWFMRFFFPRQHTLIDWGRDSESLGAETTVTRPHIAFALNRIELITGIKAWRVGFSSAPA